VETWVTPPWDLVNIPEVGNVKSLEKPYQPKTLDMARAGVVYIRDAELFKGGYCSIKITRNQEV
jgi:hypothetical protein